MTISPLNDSYNEFLCCMMPIVKSALGWYNRYAYNNNNFIECEKTEDYER